LAKVIQLNGDKYIDVLSDITTQNETIVIQAMGYPIICTADAPFTDGAPGIEVAVGETVVLRDVDANEVFYVRNARGQKGSVVVANRTKTPI